MLVSIIAAAADEASGAGGTGWAQIVLSVVGPAGLIAAVVSLFKLKPDANSQAVTQAQGAASEWQKIADDRKKDADEAEKKLAAALDLVEQLRDQLRSNP